MRRCQLKLTTIVLEGALSGLVSRKTEGRPRGSCRTNRGFNIWPWVKIQIVPPVNIPISTKIGSKMGGAPTPKWYHFDPRPYLLRFQTSRPSAQCFNLRRETARIAAKPASKDFLHGKLRLKGEALLEILQAEHEKFVHSPPSRTPTRSGLAPT